jgi:uncharacterized alkaline shock family protein YloU
MNGFNRAVATVLWLLLLAGVIVAATAPLATTAWLITQLTALDRWLAGWQEANPTYFIIGQAAVGIGGLLIFGALVFAEIMSARPRGVRIRTTEGGSAEVDTGSIGRRLQWHLDQMAEVINVMPAVKSRGGAVDIRLEIETAPDVDIPMKTDEVVEVTRAVIEQDMGLRLGKLDVHVRCAPFEPEWNT